jgi:small multidrug resistance pump
MTYFYLAIAILCEVIATSCLKASNEFKEWLPSLFVILGYLGSLYFMTLSLRKLTLGTVYATWSGLGIVLVAIFGFVFYKEKLDLAAIVGMALIIAGVLVMNLVSKTNVH